MFKPVCAVIHEFGSVDAPPVSEPGVYFPHTGRPRVEIPRAEQRHPTTTCQSLTSLVNE